MDEEHRLEQEPRPMPNALLELEPDSEFHVALRAMEAKWEKWTKAHRQGHRMNQHLLEHRSFRNPNILRQMSATMGLPEYASELHDYYTGQKEGNKMRGFYDELEYRQKQQLEQEQEQARRTAQGELPVRTQIHFQSSSQNPRK